MKVSFYATLEPIVGERHADVPLPPGARVRDLVACLSERWPGLAEHLLEDGGELSRRVNIFLEGRNVRWLDGLETLIEPGQAVDIFPPVAGG